MSTEQENDGLMKDWRADPFRPAFELWPDGIGTAANGFRTFVRPYRSPADGSHGTMLVVPGGEYARLRDAMPYRDGTVPHYSVNDKGIERKRRPEGRRKMVHPRGVEPPPHC